MAFDYDVVVLNPDGEEIELNRDTFEGSLRDTTLVSASDVNLSDKAMTALLRTYNTPDELQEAIEALANFTSGDVDVITDKFEIERLVDGADNVSIFANISDYFEDNRATMFDGIESSLLDIIIPHLDVDGFTRDFIKDEEYIMVSDDGAVIDTSQLA